MKTREQIRIELEQSNPTTNIGGIIYYPNDAPYEAVMEKWIDAMMEAQTQQQILPDAENYQIRAWMIRGDFDPDSVPQMIAQIMTDEKQRKEALMRWDYAVRVPRNFPLVNAIGAQMGLTPEQIDSAWQDILAL